MNNKYFKMLKCMVLGGEREHDGKKGKGHILKGARCHATAFGFYPTGLESHWKILNWRVGMYLHFRKILPCTA